MKKKILKPRATFKECEARVEVHCTRRTTVIIFEENIYSIKQIFELKKEKAKDLAEQWDLGRCIYLLEWAINCKANSVKIKTCLKKEVIKFRFLFYNLENMTRFVEGLDIIVNNRTYQEMEYGNVEEDESETKNLGVYGLISKLERLNLEAKFEVVNDYAILMKDITPEKVVYPEGYYYVNNQGITNKGNTFAGRYETFLAISR